MQDSENADSAIILLVEDSPDDAFFFERTLKACGVKHRLFKVEHGTAAVAFLDASCNAGNQQCPRPDIIFLDLKLPQLSGFDVLQWIKKENFQPPLHVVVLSGSDEPRDKKLALDLGAADYLVKPIDKATLKAKLKLP